MNTFKVVEKILKNRKLFLVAFAANKFHSAVLVNSKFQKNLIYFPAVDVVRAFALGIASEFVCNFSSRINSKKFCYQFLIGFLSNIVNISNYLCMCPKFLRVTRKTSFAKVSKSVSHIRV